MKIKMSTIALLLMFVSILILKLQFRSNSISNEQKVYNKNIAHQENYTSYFLKGDSIYTSHDGINYTLLPTKSGSHIAPISNPKAIWTRDGGYHIFKTESLKSPIR